MGDSLRVRNVGQGQVAFMVYPPVEFPPETPKHKRRKLAREGVRSVVIPHARVVDLVEATGVSSEVLRSLPEVAKILAHPSIEELREEKEVEAPKEEPPKEPEEPPKEPEEPPQTEEPAKPKKAPKGKKKRK